MNTLSLVVIFAFGVIFTAAKINASGVFLRDDVPHVQLTENAALSGMVERSREGKPYYSFIGIPFATIPERFAESQLLAEPNWNGTKEVTSPGPICAQGLGFIFDSKTKFVLDGEEQCLNLNIYVPANNGNGKNGFPVMVWIHGGGFYSGSGIKYGPQYFMDTEQVIVVTINYRLNVFGFLSTGDEVIPGNNGFKDQIVALKFINRFIKYFGGDQEKVSIFGESAGGISVHLLMLSPLANGLFHNAIAQSGSGLCAAVFHPNPKSYAVKLANYLKCPSESQNSLEITSQEIIKCLKEQSTEKLAEAAYNFSPKWPDNFLPLHFGLVSEPKPTSDSFHNPFLTDSPWNIVTTKEVPLMLGVTQDEGASLFAGPVLHDPKLVDELNINWNKLFPRAFELDKFLSPIEQDTVSEKVRRFYFNDEDVSLKTRVQLTNLYSDVAFDQGVRQAAIKETLKRNSPTYLYRYTHRPPLTTILNLFGYQMPEVEAKKVGHGDELLLLFDAGIPFFKLDSNHEKFSKNLIKLWTSFAIHGQPKHTFPDQQEDWKPLSKEEAKGKHPIKWFQINSSPSFIDEDANFQNRAVFWEQFSEDYFHKVPQNKDKRIEL